MSLRGDSPGEKASIESLHQRLCVQKDDRPSQGKPTKETQDMIMPFSDSTKRSATKVRREVDRAVRNSIGGMIKEKR